MAGALADEVDRLQARSGITADLQLPEDGDAVPPYAAAALLRVGQEALHNVMKHARADRGTVRLTVNGDSSELSIRDDGIGFDSRGALKPDGSGGFGLAVMKERIRLIGGQFSLESIPGRGTAIVARVPTEEEHPDGKGWHSDSTDHSTRR